MAITSVEWNPAKCLTLRTPYPPSCWESLRPQQNLGLEIRSFQRPQNSEKVFEQEALFPHRDVEHLYRKKQQPPGSLRPLVAFVESQEGTLHLDSLGVGCRFSVVHIHFKNRHLPYF